MRRLALSCAAAGLLACAEKPRALAAQITNPAQLIGGPQALGEVGDYLLENSRIRVIVQSGQYSRGFGVFAGSLIDADRVRGGAGAQSGDARGGQGRDLWGELFPAFFLEGMEPTGIEIADDGSAGGPARIRVTGRAGDFLTMMRLPNKALGLDPRKLLFRVEYALGPEDEFVRITSTVHNQSAAPVPFPTSSQPVPFGLVALFGARNDIFAPGEAGYDLRFTLEKEYQRSADAATETRAGPARLAGLAVDFLASSSVLHEGVSYGLAAEAASDNWVRRHLEDYPGARPDAVLVPLIASAFTGVFYAEAPSVLAPGAESSASALFIVGKGDIASVRDVYHRLKGIETGEVAGEVRDLLTNRPLPGASVLLVDEQDRIQNQLQTGEDGSFRGTMPPGRYTAIPVLGGRRSGACRSGAPLQGPGACRPAGVELMVEAKKTAAARLYMEPGMALEVAVRDPKGFLAPAKVTVLGAIPPHRAGLDPENRGHVQVHVPEWLYNLRIGEPFRATDFDPGRPERSYAEKTVQAARGVARLHLPAPAGGGAEYTVVASRGPEYALASAGVKYVPGGEARVTLVPERAFETPGWISADLHLHSERSIDGAILLPERIAALAAEGLEYVAATDHNFIVDYAPLIQSQGLADWLFSSVGVELSTLEMGHFNAYPVVPNLGSVTRGSPEWVGATPQTIFDALRARAAGEMVLHISHPRDTIQGYFHQYNLDQDTGQARDRSHLGLLVPNGQNPADPVDPVDEYAVERFSMDFDAVEVLTGKRLDQVRTYRVPDPIPPSYRHPAGESSDLFIIEPGKPLVRKFGAVRDYAFPGPVEDWLAFMRHGHTYTLLGNSDSHGKWEEPGYPRNYIRVGAGRDSPGTLDEASVVRAIKARKVVMTNGPMVELSAQTADGIAEVGDVIAATAGARVKLRVVVRAAPWVGVGEATLLANGVVVARFAIPASGAALRLDATTEVPVGADTHFVAEVRGQDSLWPVVTPAEVPPQTLTDAVGTLGSTLGLGATDYGDFHDTPRRKVTAYAMTNPVFVDVGGDGAFGLSPGGVPAARPVGVRGPGVRSGDLRKLFEAWGHGH